MNISLTPVGKTFQDARGFGVEIAPEYRSALSGLAGFSHVQVLWWFSQCEDAASRSKLTEQKPYKNGPAELGTFATRSPQRPNPIAVSTACIVGSDVENGILQLAWIDAFDGSPVLDIKPYTPSADRVETPEMPEWCRHWPKSIEDSEDFDWEAEFNF